MGFHVDYEPRIPLKLDNPPQLLHLGLENFSRSGIDDLKKSIAEETR